MLNVGCVVLRGLRGCMRGCVDDHAKTWFEFPRLCKEGQGEVEPCLSFPFCLVIPACGASPCKCLAGGRYLSWKFSDGVRPRTTTHFCFGKSRQNHVGRSVSPCLRRGKLFGFRPRFADPGGAQTRMAQTMRAFFPVSVPLLGYSTRLGESDEIMRSKYREETCGACPEASRRTQTGSRKLDLARDSAAPKAGNLFRVVIPASG